ncbi:MAG: peptidoglycan-binding protein [Clostridia bacterium]|nr:peptidoglycan-binding protein [Clostridia bacterium]
MKKTISDMFKTVWNKLKKWSKDTLLPWLKQAGKWMKEKGTAFVKAIPPTTSKIVRSVERSLNLLLERISSRTDPSEKQKPQRVSRPLLFLVLGVLCVVVLAALILVIALGARFFSCVCHPSNRGTEPVVLTETAEPTETPIPTPAPTINPDDTYLGGMTYQKGDTDETIAVVQQRLMDLGYMDPDEPTEHFGSVTLDAIKRFQKRNQLEETGIIDETTYALLFSDKALEYVMQLGDEGDAVEEIQDRLYELGYIDASSRTGTFGEKTQAAVIAFQTANKLEADGLVGGITREALYSDDVIGNVFKSGDTDDQIAHYQERLIELGYTIEDYTNGKMDKHTVSAIKEFQDANGLVKDGVLGPTTMNLLDSKDAQKYALRLGMSGSKVKDMQRTLRKLGYLTSDGVTGYFNDNTEEAVKRFQKRNDLTADGEVGSKTLAKLNSSDARRAPSTATPKPTPKPTKKTTPKPGTKATATPKSGAKATATPKPSNNSSSKIENFISIAQSKIGCPYVSGAKGPNKFDCSGFVYWCLNQAGVKQSYLTSRGWRTCSRYKRITSWGDFKRGDVMVFSGTSMATGHVGIYLGSGKMIDASSGAGQVRITSTVLSGSYWKQHFLMAYRIWD